MKKTLSILLIFLFIISFSGCRNPQYYYDNKEQQYLKGYEDMIHIICDKYGEYLYVDIETDNSNEGEDNELVIKLFIKGKYINSSEYKNGDNSFWIIFETIRRDINRYLQDNPNGSIFKDLKNGDGSSRIEMFEVVTNDRSRPDRSILSVVDSDCSGQFDYYTSIYPDMDYLQKSGSDLKEICLLFDGKQDEMSQLEATIATTESFPNLEIVWFSFTDTDEDLEIDFCNKLQERIGSISVWNLRYFDTNSDSK